MSLYSDGNPLEAFRVAHERKGRVLPPLPPIGALDINTVMESRYFFG